MKMNRLIFVLALSLALPVTAHAGLEDIRHNAEKGHTAAQYELGILYEFGFKLPDHETEALAWYSIAAERGSAPAAERRDLLKARLSASQVEQAEARSRQLATGMPAAPAAAPAPIEIPVPEPATEVPPPEVAPTP